MYDNYILKILEFQGSDIEFYDVNAVDIKGVKTICIYARIKNKDNSVVICPKCGSISIYKKSYSVRTIRHLSTFKCPCIVKLMQKRYQCKDCKKTFNETSSFVKKRCRISNDVKLAIIDECRKKQSFEDVAERLNISTYSVEKEFDSNVAIERNNLSSVICIDEFKADTNYGKYALIIGNPVNGEILDILPKRTQDYLFYYFNLINVKERDNVEYYITDLFESYRTIHRVFFPNSVHIADRFHWIRIATKAFNDTRIKEMNYIKKKAELKCDIEGRNELMHMYTIIKSNYRILLANKYKKEPAYFDTEMRACISGIENPTIQDILEYILNNNETIKEAYDLLQSIYKIASLSTFDGFIEDLNVWFDEVKQTNNIFFKSVMNTYKSWKTEIRNSFIINQLTKTRLTNGFIEGKNNLCKVVKRVGFGFKNFDVLRNRIMYEGNKELTITNKKK